MSQASEEKRIKREKALRDNLRKRKEKAKELNNEHSNKDSNTAKSE